MKEINVGKGLVALVDDEDFEKVSKYHWWAKKEKEEQFYVATKGSLTMHRLILNLSKNDGVIANHINKNGLDNRKENLRICNPSQLGMCRRKLKNCSSIYKGVSLLRTKEPSWRAYIKFHGKQIWLGTFSSEKEAACAYNKKAKELFGEYACLNNV